MYLQLENHREQRQQSSLACWLRAHSRFSEILSLRNSQQRQTRSPNTLSFNLLSVIVISTVTKSNLEEERAFVTYGSMFILKGVRLETQAGHWKQELKQRLQRSVAYWLAYFLTDFCQLFFFFKSALFIFILTAVSPPYFSSSPFLTSCHITSPHLTSVLLPSPLHLCSERGRLPMYINKT